MWESAVSKLRPFQNNPEKAGRSHAPANLPAHIRVHVLYKWTEIPANTPIPAIAVSVTYRKQKKPANTGSIPVSATTSS